MLRNFILFSRSITIIYNWWWFLMAGNFPIILRLHLKFRIERIFYNLSLIINNKIKHSLFFTLISQNVLSFISLIFKIFERGLNSYYHCGRNSYGGFIFT